MAFAAKRREVGDEFAGEPFVRPMVNFQRLSGESQVVADAAPKEGGGQFAQAGGRCCASSS
jgi:hypothetical protein